MSVPSTRKTLIDYCLRRLGSPVIDINIETMKKLAKLKNIIGVKDSSNDLSRPC